MNHLRGVCLACSVAASVMDTPPASHPVVTTARPAPALSISFLYDLKIGVTSLAVSKDEGLRMLTEDLLADLGSEDSLRFGFLGRHLFLSRRFAASELTDFYTRVVKTTVVPDHERFGPSPLWDELYRVVSTVAADDGRRAVIIVTDGRSTGNLRSVDELVAHAQASGVAICSMDYAPSEWFLPDRAERVRFAENPADRLRSIAAATGGMYVLVPAAPSIDKGRADFKAIRKDLEARLAEIFEVLRR